MKLLYIEKRVGQQQARRRQQPQQPPPPPTTPPTASSSTTPEPSSGPALHRSPDDASDRRGPKAVRRSSRLRDRGLPDSSGRSSSTDEEPRAAGGGRQSDGPLDFGQGVDEAEGEQVESLRVEGGLALLLVMLLVALLLVVVLSWLLAMVGLLQPGLNHGLVKLAERWPPAPP